MKLEVVGINNKIGLHHSTEHLLNLVCGKNSE